MQSKINVLHIRSSLGRYGPERNIAALARHVEQYGYRIFLTLVLSPVKGGSAREALSQHYDLPPERLKIFPGWDPFIIANLCATIRRWDIRLIETHDMRSNLLGFIASRITGIPNIANVHGWTRRNIVVRALEIWDRILLGHCNKVITVSRSLQLEIGHVPREKIVTIWNAIALEDPPCGDSCEPLSFAQEEGSLAVGAFTRLSPEKGHSYFLRACAVMPDEFRQLRILLVGDGPLKSELQKLAAKLGIAEKVIFTGFRDDAIRIMKSVDVVVVPSLREACPRQVLEALSLNKAIISTDVGDVTKIAGGCRNVHIVPKASVEALRMAMVDLLGKKLKGESLSSNGRDRVEEKFSAPRMAREYAATYRSICESPGK